MEANTIYACIFCNRELHSKMSKSQHQRLCKYNPNKVELSNNFKKKTCKHKCRFCNIGMNKKSLTRHEILCDKNPNLDFVNEYHASGKRQINQYVKAKMLGEEPPKLSDESIERFRNASLNKKHSKETKLKISECRKKYLKENPDKHPWKNKNKQISGPCEYLKDILKSKNIEFIEEHSPLIERHFSIDIAFPDNKVGIEVNGNQHYNSDKTLAPYYQIRNDLISAEGWTLYEIHYSKVFDMSFVEELLEKIKLKESISYDFYIKKDKSKFIGPPKANWHQLKHIDDQKILEKLKLSNINFMKLGWVEQASKIIGVTPQKTGCWIKRMDPEFYETCYKRKRAL